MADDQTQQQPTPEQQAKIAIAQEGLSELYREFGRITHALYERNVMIQQIQGEVEKRNDMLRQVQEKYGPKPEPPDGEAVPADAEPTPLKRQKGAG